MQHGSAFLNAPPTHDLCLSSRGVCWIWWEPAHLWERWQGKGHQPSQRKIWLQDGGDDWRRSYWSGGVSPCCEFPLNTLFKLSCFLYIQLCFVKNVALVSRKWKIICVLIELSLSWDVTFYWNYWVFYLRKEPTSLVMRPLRSSTTCIK